MSQLNNNHIVSNLLKPDLIQYLIKKLKIGNLRGSHLNCLPGKTRNRLSLYDLNKILQTEQIDFLKLLTENATFSINIDIPHVSEEKYEELLDFELNKPKNYKDFIKERVVLSRRLNNISYDLKNEIQEYGTKSFGFGFPTLVIADPSKPDKLLVAPLLIWYLELKQDINKSNNWILSKSEDNPIVFNEVLFNYLKESHKVLFDDFKDIQERILEDGVVDCEELNELISLFEKKINQTLDESAKKNFEELVIEDYPTKDHLLEKIGKKRFMLISNGTFAFFRTYKESIIQDMENMLKNLSELEAEEAVSYQSDYFSAISTDPSQSKLLESLGNEREILIQGPPGTGKSQSLTAILTNALRSRVKCLVVCEKKTAMEILYSNMKKFGLEHLAIMIDDPIKDRNSVVQAVREKVDHLGPSFASTYLEKNMEQEIIEYVKFREKLEKHHKLKNTKQINNDRRQDLIGKLLQSDSFDGYVESLSLDSFAFDEEEYRNSKEAISQFEIMSSFLIDDDPLLSISSDFVQSDYNKAKRNLLNTLESLIELLNYLSKNSISSLEQYKRELKLVLKKNSSKLFDLTENILTHYSSVSSEAKKKIDHDTLDIHFSTKLLANISTINKEILQFKKDSSAMLIKIKENLDSNAFFGEYFEIEELENLNIKMLLVEIKKLNEFCNERNINNLINNHIKECNLNSNLFIDSQAIKLLKKNHEKYTTLLKESNLNIQMLNIDDQISYKSLAEVSKNKLYFFKAFEERLDYLQDYYFLLKFIDQQDINIKKLLQVLSELPRQKWLSTFDEWFMYNFLSENKAQEIFKNDNDIKNLIKKRNSIRNLYPKIIKNYWQSILLRTVLRYKNNPIGLKSLYNLRGANGKRRNSLRTIMNYDFEGFTNFFPIVLTNPSTVSSIFPMKLRLFDVVIFDEASQLRVEDTFASFLRGGTHIISGDKHQMPPSSFFISEVDVADEDASLSAPEGIEGLQKILEKNHLFNLVSSESLLEFANQQNFKEVYLDIHYRSKHPDLIEFSNKAFYGSRLVPTPPVESDKPPIKFYQVDGLYQSEDGINIKECEKIIDIINNEYKENHDIKIGVATLNLHQRNLILDKLSELSAKDSSFAEMMSNLDQNGFFVKNLENIQGDERDIIIISTTFGIRENGSFIQNFGPITRKGGYRLLNVIITRAQKRLHVVTSVPHKFYSQYDRILSNEGNDGKAIFYAYLSYAKAVSEGDFIQKEKVLKDIAGNVDINNFSELELTESPFEEEVYQRINKHIQKGKFHLQQKVGGFRLDMVVDTKDPKKKIVIECDGATYHRSEEAHYWDVFRQEYLESLGYIFHRIWSENWFEDAASETRKLLAFIEANNGYLNK